MFRSHIRPHVQGRSINLQIQNLPPHPHSFLTFYGYAFLLEIDTV